MFCASANAAAPPPAAAPAFGFGAVAPSVTSSSGLQSEALEKSFRCRLFGIYTFCFLFQLRLQLHPHLHLVRRHLVDLGPVRLLLLAHPLDLLSQHRLPNPPPLLEPILIPIPLLSLDSRPTPPLHLGQMLIHQQVGICHSCIDFHLHPCLGIGVLYSTGGGFQFGAMDLEPRTTLQVFLLSVREQLHLLPPLPTQPSHPRLEQLGLDSTLHKPPPSILGMLCIFVHFCCNVSKFFSTLRM